jgi:catechol 2,3-dioxygenase-like lactoylglutathione lyase family enzyme
MSHTLLICRDMEEGVRFYRDVLGLRLISTSGTAAQTVRDTVDTDLFGTPTKRDFRRLYFFELPDGAVLGLYEIPGAADGREQPPVAHWFWPGGTGRGPTNPMKMDHLAFNVNSAADVDWFMEHLEKHGVPYCGPMEPQEGAPTPFMHRIHFYDPSGNALEIATAFVDEHGEPFATSIYLLDTEPVSALLRG